MHFNSNNTIGKSKKKKNEYHEKSSIFSCHSFQKVKPSILYRFITQSEYFKPLFLEMLMIMTYR